MSVCVVTEAHLRARDLGILKIPGFVAVSSFCQKSEGKRVGGGVAILVAGTLTAANCPVETCSAVVYTGDGQLAAVRMTGVYVPPAKIHLIEKGHLLDFTRLSGSPVRGGTVGAPCEGLRPVKGDFNPAIWMETFDEWGCVQELRHLDDPRMPTHNSGGVPDRIHLAPGEHTQAEVESTPRRTGASESMDIMEWVRSECSESSEWVAICVSRRRLSQGWLSVITSQ